MASTIGIQPITLASSVGVWPDAYTYWFAEGSSQSFLAGMPVILSSGLVVIVASTTAPVMVGISVAKATGTTGTVITNNNCAVQLVMPNTIWQVSMDTTFTTANPAPATGKPSSLTVGTSYSMCVDSTSGLACMTTGTGNPVFQYLGCDPSQNSVLQGRCYVRILTSQTAWT
jgi:hypothetical protein